MSGGLAVHVGRVRVRGLGGDSARLELASELLLRVRDRGLLRDPGYPAHPCRDHRAGGAPAGAAPPRGSGRPRSRTVHDEAVAEHAAANPLEPGMPLETARQITGMPDTRLVELLLGQQLTVTDGRVHTAGPVHGLPSAVRRAIDEIRAELMRRRAGAGPARRARAGHHTARRRGAGRGTAQDR
ncbi:MAG: hypothetical protein ACRDRU_18230 [Pseudonocardiaceae bacterium]